MLVILPSYAFAVQEENLEAYPSKTVQRYGAAIPYCEF